MQAGWLAEPVTASGTGTGRPGCPLTHVMPTFDEWIRISVIADAVGRPVPVVDDRAADAHHTRVVHGCLRRDDTLIDSHGHRQQFERGAGRYWSVTILTCTARLLRVVDLVGGEVVRRIVGCSRDVAVCGSITRISPPLALLVSTAGSASARPLAARTGRASAPGPTPAWAA